MQQYLCHPESKKKKKKHRIYKSVHHREKEK